MPALPAPTPPTSTDRDPWPTFAKVAGSRRAIRHFLPRRVEEADLRRILDASLNAPTSGNLQPFELVWVRSPEVRQRVVRACLDQPPAKTAAELVVAIARWDRCEETRAELVAHLRETPGPHRVEAFFYDHLAHLSYDLGPLGLSGRARELLLAPLRLAMPLPRGPVTRADVRTWAIKSTALVCDHFMLAARARGLDTCPIGGTDPVRVGRAVGLSRWGWKRSWDLAMVIAIGHRDPGTPLETRWRRARDRLVREV